MRYTAAMTRYLRFAAAGFFLVLAIALLALWVRSFYYQDRLFLTVRGTHFVVLDSRRNVASFVVEEAPDQLTDELSEWSLVTTPTLFKPMDKGWPRGVIAGLGFSLNFEPGIFWLEAPHWFIAMASATAAAIFAFKRTWRFSIRTLLIATTLVAAALGLGVCLL